MTPLFSLTAGGAVFGWRRRRQFSGVVVARNGNFVVAAFPSARRVFRRKWRRGKMGQLLLLLLLLMLFLLLSKSLKRGSRRPTGRRVRNSVVFVVVVVAAAAAAGATTLFSAGNSRCIAGSG